MQILIFSIIWVTGAVISYLMQRTEIASEKEILTFGSRLLALSLSLLSFLWILVILITSWVKQISRTGYWNEPVTKVVEEIKLSQSKTTAN